MAPGLERCHELRERLRSADNDDIDDVIVGRFCDGRGHQHTLSAIPDSFACRAEILLRPLQREHGLFGCRFNMNGSASKSSASFVSKRNDEADHGPAP